MKNIREFSAEQIKHWDCQIETVNGWKLARPMGYYYTGTRGLFRRFRLAWKVFTGRADVLTWHLQ